MANIEFKLDGAGLRQLLGSSSGPVAKIVVRATNQVHREARRLCPVDEGRLKASISQEVVMRSGGPVGQVGSNLPYAIFVHEGRGWVYPRKGRFLRWPAKNNSGAGNRRYSGGRTSAYVFAKKAKPVKGRPFLRDALKVLR